MPERGHSLPGLEPVDRECGISRGEPIDRWYVHQYLWERRADVRGRVMEVNDSGYTDYLGEGDVTRCDVVHPTADNPMATLVGDLVTGEGIPTRAFRLRGAHPDAPPDLRREGGRRNRTGRARARRRGAGDGAGISPINGFDQRTWGEFWRFTADSARRLFADAFGAGNVEVETYGNVAVAAAFLYGYALEDLTEAELAHRDDDFQFLIGVRAVA